MAKYAGQEFESCDRCDSPAGQLVAFKSDQHEEALCFTCWKPLSDKGEVKVLSWINKYGRLAFEKGATTGPFRIKHE